MSYYQLGLQASEPFVDKALAFYHQGRKIYHGTEIGLAVGNIAYRHGINVHKGGDPEDGGQRYRVGLALYHTVGDRERAIAEISAGFATLANELASQLGWTQDHPSIDEKQTGYTWYHNVAVPALNEWQAFQATQTDSWWSRWATSWDVYEHWMDRLKDLRNNAEHNGFNLTSAAPADLMETIWKAAPKAAENLIWTLIKIILVGGAVIIGGVLLARYL